MRVTKKRRKLNNKGLTLIEMVVAIAIIGIFSTVVMTFITSGANFYRKVSLTTKLQSDMQTTLESIENLILDTNVKITYRSGQASISNDLGNTASVNKELMLERTNEEDPDSERHPVTQITWLASEQTLYYNEGTMSNGSLEIKKTQQAVMAENVSSFQMDISKAQSQGIVVFRLTLEKGDRKISQLYTVTLRNKVSTE